MALAPLEEVDIVDDTDDVSEEVTVGPTVIVDVSELAEVVVVDGRESFLNATFWAAAVSP